MTVWDEVIGQPEAVDTLRAAVAGGAVAHAWLFTGPPGSGRSVAARAFAAALQCPRDGCGECEQCRTVLAGTHPDLEVVTPAGLHFGVSNVRGLVLHAARVPSAGRWLVTLVEDADRLTEDAQNALLKAIEEPPPRGVWLLCAPGVEDLLPTIRSRCRHLALRIPAAAAVAAALVARDGVSPEVAAFVARVAGGHIGRARRLARDEGARLRRDEVLGVPARLTSVPESFAAAADLVDAAKEEAAALVGELNAAETATLSAALGAAPGKARPRGTAGAFSDLEREQKLRATRLQRDALDRALGDLASFYRDVLVVQLSGGAAAAEWAASLINADREPIVVRAAAATSAESTVRRLQAIGECGAAIDANVAPQLAVEAMTLALLRG